MENLTRAYQLDEQGVLVGETMVQEDPMEPGVYLLPPGCVLLAPPAVDADTQVVRYRDGAWDVHDRPSSSEPTTAPVEADVSTPRAVSAIVPTQANQPKAGEHEIALIVDGQWAVVADWRGTAYWLPNDDTAGPAATEHRITELGQTPPDGALFSPPPAPLRVSSTSLADAQAVQIATLRSAWQSATECPVNFTTAAGHADGFACDAASVAKLDAMLAAYAQSGTWPPNLWLNASGMPVTPFTFADMQALARAVADRATPDYEALLLKIGQVMAAATTDEVQAIGL
ncbi:hypothetical protein AWB75_06014 [Caballeronia catudaia]|uniref:DUF4376 domain-containing protein n=1 Tax=Caballeronia catudaia TaxID=1777136 RepID=A0A158D062_9BURK|nr:hypothetical protein [Caballeronia catudaia]SAK88025.1 hypothetical protein AWB75_06014 [Caballeronia catudaia]